MTIVAKRIRMDTRLYTGADPRISERGALPGIFEEGGGRGRPCGRRNRQSVCLCL